MSDKNTLQNEGTEGNVLLAEQRRKIGVAIDIQRQEKGISYRQLADEIGLKHPQIIRIVNGENCKIDTLTKVLEGLDLELTIKRVDKEHQKDEGGNNNEINI